MALRDALQKVNELVKDLTSLHVQTFTGTVKFDLSQAAEGEMFKTVGTQAATANAADGSGVTLVAESFFQFDGDSYNFLTSDDVPSKAIELHKSAVEAGIKTRQGLMELISGIFD